MNKLPITNLSAKACNAFQTPLAFLASADRSFTG